MTARLTPVLMFHHVEAVEGAALAPPPVHANSYLSRQQFAACLDLLAGGGYRTVTFAEAAQHARAGRPAPRRSVVLTFDDGCRCFHDHALPEITARGMTATLFAVSGEIGGSNRWDRAADESGNEIPTPRRSLEIATSDLATARRTHHERNGLTEQDERSEHKERPERKESLLSAAELRAIAATGVEIASHSRHHRDLTACDAAVLDDEVAGSRADLVAATGAAVSTFCYPYGHLDAAARAAVERAGYLAGAAIHGLTAARAGDPFAWPRFAVNPGDSPFELRLKASGAYAWWSRMPRLGLLRTLRRQHHGASATEQSENGAPAVHHREPR